MSKSCSELYFLYERYNWVTTFNLVFLMVFRYLYTWKNSYAHEPLATELRVRWSLTSVYTHLLCFVRYQISVFDGFWF